MMNNRIQIFVAFLFMVIVLPATAQERAKHSVVLKDGSRVSGTILYDSLDLFSGKMKKPTEANIKSPELGYIKELNLEKRNGRQAFRAYGVC